MHHLPDRYVDLMGREYDLTQLDNEEKKLLNMIQRKAKSNPDWNEFENYFIKAVAEFYDARGLPRKQTRQKAVYKVAQDLWGRIAIASGMASPPDYRDALREIINERFKTRREFCEFTGLSEDMLSHVLAYRRHLSIDTLTKILDKLGYTLRIVPREETKIGA